MKEFDIEKVVVPSSKELASLADTYRERVHFEDATEDYLDGIDEYVNSNVPSLIGSGRLEEAWNAVMQAYTQLTDEDIEDYDDNEMHESCLSWMKKVCVAVKDEAKKAELLELLMWLEKTEEMPCWVRSASGDLAHDLFDEPEFLEKIAAWYQGKYEEDPVENGALWKGKLRDVAERLGSDKWKAVYEGMRDADPVFTDLVYAECIARRKDDRCLAIWKRIEEEELDTIESEEDVSILYSILWARYDWYEANGTDDEAQEAADALDEFVALLHDDECGDDCCCGHHHEDEEEDECGCGHHHHHDDEEHECGCGHHHHEGEEHECGCGHHHHEGDEHECGCGHHHDN